MTGRLTASQGRHQTATKPTIGQHVDDEVDGQVENGHRVSDCRVEVVPASALAQLTVNRRPENVVDHFAGTIDSSDFP